MLLNSLRVINNIGYKRNITTLRSHVNTSSILTSECLEFVDKIHNLTKEKYDETMKLRRSIEANNEYGFRTDTQSIIEGDWKVENYDMHKKLENRHVEITGPANNKRMVINAMNSGANGYMTDLEDSMTPSWENVINGHKNISEAVRGTLTDTKYDSDGNVLKNYKINEKFQPTFFVRSRGLHMKEQNVLDSNCEPISALVFDIATHLHNNGHYLNDNKKGPFLYTPKLESYEDALFVNDVISHCEKELDLPYGTVKTTVLLETYPAIFQTHEIVYALRDHIAGLNCGRWDYLFSMIKCLGDDLILPDRNLLTMDQPFFETYVKQIVSTCHKRGIHAMGGMSAFIPSGDKEIWENRLNAIQKDKEQEIRRGCDGAWVAHPGLVYSIQKVFREKLGAHNQIKDYEPEAVWDVNSYKRVRESDVNKFSYSVLENNINVAIQYVAAWLSGNGAVALNGLMEDLATAEISIHQVRQWYNNKTFNLNRSGLKNVIDLELYKVKKNNEVSYASKHFDQAAFIVANYIFGNGRFLGDVANEHLMYKNGFKGLTFDEETLYKLGGSHPNLHGVELTKHRGNFLNRHLYEENHPAYKFLGTSNGVSAVNVVAGGKGFVGPYAGGWQTNAMKNRLGMLLPDTLHVSPEEAANCAEEINNHLERADCVQHIQKITNPDFPDVINYYDIALLADMEQGWNTPEKTRISVKRAIQNGINVIHIEDQGEKKRCGHLGDKELNTYDDYAVILRSANLAAQELLGSEQSDQQWVRFVARTDAYSAKRIVNSANLHDPNNDEHKFVDWERGVTPDGKYLYLKQGTNKETGRTWGLELSIERCAKVVDQGLASHVWMETPDADLQVAKDFITGVNDILLPKGKRAYGLYNHSPSFDWDVKFFAEAKPLAEHLYDHMSSRLSRNNSQYDDVNTLKKFFKAYGFQVNGDHNFTQENLETIIRYCRNGDTTDSENIKKITEIIVDQRLCNFSDQLADFGFNLHLITLPEFHVTAFNMHKLSSDFIDDGINAFVKYTQRPERIVSENDPTYTYYKHQTATGTGVEAAFSEAVGSSNVNMLSESTEADDLKKRA